MKDDLIKTTPAVSVAGMDLFGVPVPDLVQIATLVWLILLIVDKLAGFAAKYMEKKHGKGHCVPPSRSAPDRDGGVD